MITLLFIVLSAILDSQRDKIQFDPKRSFFPNAPWWVTRNYMEKRLGGSWVFDTVLSFANDGWHLCKWMVKVLLITAIVVYEPMFGVWDILLYLVIHNVTFEIFYKHI